MPTIPDSLPQQLAFCESHWPIWQANAVAIGVTAGQVVAFKNVTEEFRAGYDASILAREASRAATTMHNAREDALASAGDLVRTIRAFAEQTDNPDVYALAQIPPPAAPSPVPPPSKPIDLRVTLEPGGALSLAWKSTGAGGAYFTVQRRIGASGAFTAIGSSPSKSFTDATLPYASASATYIVTGVRNSGGGGGGPRVGESSEPIMVQFGVGGEGGLTISGVTGGQLGLAA